jgi:hypothetical protein
MKKLILCFTPLCILPCGAQAGVMLGTTNPPGSPLVMPGGTTSGPMFVTVVSDNNDVMQGWQFSLRIVPDGGATGTLTFNNPPTGPAPNPPNYVFDSHGVGITSTNSGNQLDLANDNNDILLNPLGTTLPTSQLFNLLEVDFLASATASGLFGVYAIPGAFTTVWTDGAFTSQDFSNVPQGGGDVRIGEVNATAITSVPEPSTLTLLGLGGCVWIGYFWRRLK